MSPANHRDRTADEQAALDKQHEDARSEMKALEDGDSVPSDPSEWPTGKAKFLTFGNADDDAYGDGSTAMLGPAGLELHADGRQTIRGRPRDEDATARAEAAPEESAQAPGRSWFGRRKRS